MKHSKYYAAFIFYFTAEMFVPLFIGVLMNIHNTPDAKARIFHMALTLFVLLILSHLIVRKRQLSYVYLLVPLGVLMMIFFGSYWLTALLLTGFSVWTLEQLHDNIHNHYNEKMIIIMLLLVIIINLIGTPAIMKESMLLHLIAAGMFVFYFLGRAVMLMTDGDNKISDRFKSFAVISLAILSIAAIFTGIYNYAVFGIQTVLIFLLNGFILMLRPFFSFLETVEFKFPDMPQEEMEVNEAGDAVEETFERGSIISTAPVMTILLVLFAAGIVIFLILYFKYRSRPKKENRAAAVYKTTAQDIQSENSRAYETAPPDSRVRKEYYAFEKWLAKKNLGRYHGETIDEWVERVKINDAAMIERYKKYRYDNNDLSASEFTEFKEMIRSLKKNLNDKSI